MQAIKEKLNDISVMRKAKAEAREEEKAEKEMAKARLEVAHEMRIAREAEAAMDLHVQKAAGKMVEHERKHPQMTPDVYGENINAQDPCGRNDRSEPAGYSADTMYGGDSDTASMDSTASLAGSPNNNNLL